MPKYTIQVPDGRKVTAEAPDEASAMAGIQEWYAAEEAKAAKVLPGAAAGAGAVTPLMGPQQNYEGALREVRAASFPNATDEEFQRAVEGLNMKPLNTQQIAQQDQLFGFGDELAALSSAGTDALMGKDFGGSFAAWQRLNEARRDLGVEQNGGMGQAASVLGQLTSLGASAPGRAAAAPSLLKTAATSGTTGAIMGGVQGFGSTSGDVGQRLQGAQTGAIAGGIVGAAAPLAFEAGGKLVNNFLQNRATSAAIKNAPSAADLKQASSSLFKSVDQSGVTVDTNKFSGLVNQLAQDAKKMRINPSLDPKATGAYEELIGALADVQKNGGALTISDIHTLRQIAQKAAISTEGRDAMFANKIVDGLDNFVTQSGNLVVPANRLGSGSNAGNDLMKAISTWGQARRVGLIEEAIYKAGNQASGVENGLRIQFRQLLQNKKTRSLFTKAEIQALEKVANGTGTANIARLIGKFGFGGGSASNMLGGTIGASAGLGLGGPLGAVIAAVLGTGAKKLSGVMTEKAAERAARVVATPNIPQIVRNPRRIQSTTIPLLAGGD